MSNKTFIICLGVFCVLEGGKSILEGDFRSYGPRGLPGTFFLALGVFILLFYVWDWLKKRKQRRKK